MRKRKLDGKTYYVFTDADYEAVVGVHIAFDQEDDDENRHLCCHGCVDRFAKKCPTKLALNIRSPNGRQQVCNVRILDEQGLAQYMAHRMGATHD